MSCPHATGFLEVSVTSWARVIMSAEVAVNLAAVCQTAAALGAILLQMWGKFMPPPINIRSYSS